MIKTVKNFFIGVVSVAILALGVGMTSPFIPQVAACDDGYTLQNGACIVVGDDDLPKDLTVVIKNIVNVALYVLGALSVLMLIYGGFRYTTSGGKSESIVAAKNTILYAIIGVIVALLSYAIVNFVITAFTKSA